LGPDTYHATTARLVKQSTSKRGRGHQAVIAHNKVSVSETPPYQQVLVGDQFLLHHSVPFFIADTARALPFGQSSGELMSALSERQ
jgi:hypothetical protein